VVSDQARQPIICAQLAKEPAAVDGMKARIEQVRCVANVMEPRSCYKEISDYSWKCRQPLCLDGYGLNMLPSCRQRTSQLALRELSRSVLTNHDRDSTWLPTTMTTWTAQSPTLPAQPASARCKASSGTAV